MDTLLKTSGFKRQKALRGSVVMAFLSGALLLSGCVGGGSSPDVPAAKTARTLTINISGSGNLNPGPSGKAAPLALRLYVLRGFGRFQSLDYFALRGGGGQLGGDVVDSRAVSIRPGSSRTLTMTSGLDGAYIAVVGGFREIDSARWRSSTRIGDSDDFAVRAGKSSVSISRR